MNQDGPAQSSVASYVTADADGKRVLRVVGDLDLSTCPSFKAMLAAATADYDDEMIVDLTDVGFMDSSGLHALMATMKDMTAKGGSLRVRNPGDSVYRLLEISGMLDYLRVTR